MSDRNLPLTFKIKRARHKPIWGGPFPNLLAGMFNKYADLIYFQNKDRNQTKKNIATKKLQPYSSFSKLNFICGRFASISCSLEMCRRNHYYSSNPQQDLVVTSSLPNLPPTQLVG